MKHSALQSSARLSPSLPECGRNDPAICLGEDEGSPISRVSGPRVNLWWSHTSIHVMGESNVCTYMYMVYIPCTWYGHCLSPATSCIVLTIVSWYGVLAVSGLKCCLWCMLRLWWLVCCLLEHPGAMSKFSDYMASLHGCSTDETQPASAMALERLGRAPPQRIGGQWWWGVSKPEYDDAGYAHQDVIYTSWCPHPCLGILSG